MTLVSTFCFLILLLIVTSCFKKGSDIFSPGRTFGLIWSLAIGLADFKFSSLQHDWHPYAWATLLLGVTSFLLGIFIVYVISLNKPLVSIRSIRNIISSAGVREKVLLKIIILLFVAYSGAYLIEWFNFGTLPIFAQFPDQARSAFPMFGIHLLVNAMPIILFLIAQYFLMVKKRSMQKVALSVIFVVIVVSSFMLLNRLFFVLSFVLLLTFGYYASRFVRPRNVILALGVTIAVFAYVQHFREVRYVEQFLYSVSGMRYPRTYAAVTGPYMYIVMNLENFARAVVRLDHHTFGYYTFDFVMALSGLKHWLADYFGLERSVFLISGYNTFPFSWDYYYDFGLLGVALLPMTLGFAIASVHRWMRSQPSLVSIGMYSIVFFVLLLSFFTNNLTSLNFVANTVILLISQFLITPQRA